MIKIHAVEIENFKRAKLIKLQPTENGLTVIGGRNNQGKTSSTDAIAWALGGDRFRPSQPWRDGSVTPPNLHIVMSNGLVVERKGKNSDLKVIDPSGQKGGQQILNEFVELLALDLPRFMQSNSKEKANILLKIIGVGDKLYELEKQEQELYNRRHAIGQIADQKAKFAKEMTFYPDAPKELVSASELIRQQQDILARNGENQRKRQRWAELTAQAGAIQRQIDDLIEKQKAILADLEIANKSVRDLHDESTAELEKNISDIEAINVKVRTNLDKEKAEDDSRDYRNQYDDLSAQLGNTRRAMTDLLQNANLPLPGLSVENGELTYNGFRWDNMSGSDQLKVSTAIVRKLNPQCGFVLLDKLEQMDLDTMREFGAWLEQEGLQAIATRVSTGDECSLIIEDGYVVGDESAVAEAPPPTWKEGQF